MIEIVAEIGSNHCGDFELACEHIGQAKECGATGVKFQLFRAESLDSRPEIQAELRKWELPLAWLDLLRDCAHKQRLSFGVTPFALDLIEPLRGIVDWVKVSAYDLTYTDLLQAVKRLKVRTILSTAMATEREIKQADESYWPHGLTLLAGVAAYPAEVRDYRWRIAQMVQRYRDWQEPWGLSDHTLESGPAELAASLGATWFEKHFALEHIHGTPDAGVSTRPEEFRVYVERIRAVEGKMKEEGPLPVERDLFETCRRSNSKSLRG